MKVQQILRTVCIAIFPLLLQCKNGSQVEMQIMEDETKCITLTQKLRLLEMQSKQADVITDSDVQMVNQSGQQARLKLADMRDERDSLHAYIHSLEGEFVKIEKAVIAHKRNSAMGLTFAVFETKLRTYQEITIKSVSEAGLEIKHSNGSARITPMQLSEAQLDEFGLSVENASEVIAEEQKNQQSYMANMERVLEKQHAEELSRVRMDEEHRRAMQKAEATLAANRAPERRSLLSQAPITRVYPIRRTQSQFYNVWYPYSTNGSCGYNHSSSNVFRASVRSYETPKPPCSEGIIRHTP